MNYLQKFRTILSTYFTPHSALSHPFMELFAKNIGLDGLVVWSMVAAPVSILS